MAKFNVSASLVPSVFILLTTPWLKLTTGNRTSLYMDEIHGLSELPMTELMHIKSSLANEQEFLGKDEEDIYMSGRTFSLPLPVALPLKRADKKPVRRYGEHYEEKGKDTKISRIFQLAVTALSFLAFGGYLLTLIITAIRRSSGNMGNGNVIVLSNLQGLQGYTRPKRDVFAFHPEESDFEIEKLYQGMIMLSRSYAMQN
ncbi:uncharacterized protein LOC143376739 isoform X1 [Andrena cerasifolii]|uniref:uncharacterized protein LOC143376739 isoform X1 n=1 Tax=Andrena cerasifolii TaxID=2819439 RepID=UPI00403802E6